MNRRIFMWLASLGPAFLSARKSFARTGRYAHVTNEMIRRNEKLIVQMAREGRDGLVKEFFGGSVKLYRFRWGSYAQAHIAGPYWFWLKINEAAFLERTKGAPFCTDDYMVNKFTLQEISGFVTGTVTGSWGGVDDPVDLDRFPAKLASYCDESINLYACNVDKFLIGINKQKLVEYGSTRQCEIPIFTVADLVGKGHAGRLTEEMYIDGFHVPEADPRMVKLTREAYDRGDYITSEELLNDIRIRDAQKRFYENATFPEMTAYLKSK